MTILILGYTGVLTQGENEVTLEVKNDKFNVVITKRTRQEAIDRFKEILPQIEFYVINEGAQPAVKDDLIIEQIASDLAKQYNVKGLLDYPHLDFLKDVCKRYHQRKKFETFS